MFEIISRIAGISGFIISIINFVYFFLIRRKKIGFRIEKIGVEPGHGTHDLLKIEYSFENQSQLPVSITRIQVLVENQLHDCLKVPIVIDESVRKSGKEIIERNTVKTSTVPINLFPLAAASGYFAFAIPPNSLSDSDTNLTFRICTNRGKAIQKTFLLHEDTLIR